MSRESAYIRMLDASAKMQWNVAMILEAKALEAEKVRAWIVNHVTPESFSDQQDHLKSALRVHGQMVDVIDGLTKLNAGLTSVLKAALDGRGDAEGGMDDAFGGSYDDEERGQ